MAAHSSAKAKLCDRQREAIPLDDVERIAADERRPLVAYHSDPEIKARYLARVAAHAAADQLQKGSYWENGKGCAVGCTVHGNDHPADERELGIPRALARLEDVIFEALPDDLAMIWPHRFLEAIQLGQDLSTVAARFYLWLLTEESPPPLMTPDAAEGVTCALSLAARRAHGKRVDWDEYNKAADGLGNADIALDKVRSSLKDQAYHARSRAHLELKGSEERERFEKEAAELADLEEKIRHASYYLGATHRLVNLLRCDIPMPRDTAGIIQNAGCYRDRLGLERSVLRMSEKLLVLLAGAPI